MTKINQEKLIRDALGSPIPSQYWDHAKQVFIVPGGEGVDFTKLKLIRDALGYPIPQFYDNETGVFSAITIGTNNTSKSDGTMVLDGSTESNWVKRYGYAMHVDNEHTLHAKQGITAVSNGTATAIRNNNIRPFILKNRQILTMFVYVENSKNVTGLAIYLANDIEYASYRSYEFGANTLVEGWNELRIDLNSQTENEGPFDSSVKSVQLVVVAREEMISKVTFDSIFVGEATKKPSVIFTFDDAWTSQYELAFPMMLERGFKGNIGVISNWVGKEVDIMTESQIEEMYRYGWDMFNHTANHPNLTNVSVETAVNEILSCKRWLNERGYDRASNILAYPYGGHNKEIVKALQPHLHYARTLVEGLEPTFPLEVLKGKTKNVLTLPAATVINYVDQAITTQSTLVFCLHKIGTEQDEWGTTYNRSDFATLLDYIYEKKDLIDVKTISEWVSENKS
ncbi:polysaccharide deacetylase family protein [Lysinibacillus sp. RC79]|uniref:polysaccharide deacetylase family protein n=1 Tax=Lysinibacillus sp. RC79 TaxID=3156296 RepID=UPI003510F5F5